MASRFTSLLRAVSALPFALGVLAQPYGPRKEFGLDVTWGQYSPVGGASRDMFMMNGQTPGPTIEVDQDDWVVVRVQNDSPFNITIHFHGIEMYGTPWSDGVPGVTQRPIRPGDSFVHEFKATQHGSYWYHAHYRGHIEDGFMGPIVIHPRRGDPKPFSMISDDPQAVLAMEAAEMQVRPLLVTDWMHLTSDDKWAITVDAALEMPCYDAILFNGKGRVQCLTEEQIEAHISQGQRDNLDLVEGSTFTDKGCLPPDVMGLVLGDPEIPINTSVIPEHVFYGCNPTDAEIEVITVPEATGAERWVAIDLIAGMNFIRSAASIDEHDMWVYAMDGSYIEPQRVQAIRMASGERYSVLVKTDEPGDFRIRVNSVSVPQMLTGYALLSVDGPSKRQDGAGNDDESGAFIDIVGTPAQEDVEFFDQTHAAPFPPQEIPQSADELYIVNMRGDGATYLWALNNSRLMPADFEDEAPILMDTPHIRDNVTLTTRNGTWIDLVFMAARFPLPPHPIHKHGNKMYYLGSGTGRFRWASLDDAMEEEPQNFNLRNPPQRDTFDTPQARGEITWMVVRYEVSNPGPWMLHCHISNHMMGGMSMVIQDGVDAWPEVPAQYRLDTIEEQRYSVGGGV
ncbi:hypothetical protein S7711_03421 [Stachybotrys chartarum IBT 7711]|uniref:Uncharacterized protein n=1 Tax=Stachybotrys chartarum (strain CBS 109288 / IBT 7711) TaxID=1280523 RepID=A0A084AY23_STACB|nr:hypothetical protein S7711_03421 [Stachybotrys chartarum IBT 7711]KFA46114.1 hypothetical protein S40293_03796 [Stachybotrys chartarum IBT 40293]KFA81918.1 hypothetical protein S40288_06897 [Stachybotrys chartarum IBT 40288]